MTTQHDADRRLRTFLEDGPTELPDRTYELVRAEIEHTRQRVVIGPWREATMSRLARVAIAVAAVIVVIVGAIQLLPGDRDVGSPSAAPPSALPAASLPVSGSLQAGRYRFEPPFTSRPFTIDVPAGWSVAESSFIIKGASAAPIDRVEDSVISFSPWIVDHLFTDGCNTQDGLQPVEQSKQALIGGLARLPDRAQTSPVDTTVDGLPATSITLKVASDFDLAGCENVAIRNWPDPGGETNGGWLSVPGQTDEITVVDSGGDPVVLVLSFKGGARPPDVDAMRRIMSTIRFEPRDSTSAAPSAAATSS